MQKTLLMDYLIRTECALTNSRIQFRKRYLHQYRPQIVSSEIDNGIMGGQTTIINNLKQADLFPKSCLFNTFFFIKP